MGAFSNEASVAFVHIPKTGGHSVRQYAAAHIPGMQEIDENLPRSAGHVALRDWETYTGTDPRSYKRIYAVVRNPYDHQYSQWAFWKDCYAIGYRVLPYEVAALYPNLTHWLHDPMADWHIYDARPIGNRRKTTAGPKGYREFGGYYPYWLAIDGAIPDNVHLVRFEHLNRDFPAALEDIVGGRYEMPHSNRGPRYDPDPLHYYTPMALDIVESKFQWAFKHLYDKLER